MSLPLCPTCPMRGKRSSSPSPTGPRPCRVMLVGEGPAADEYKRGRVFAGKTGDEMNDMYLPIAGLDRDDVYITNASKCAGTAKNGKFDNPTDDQARACAEYLLPIELREVRPRVVVVMGAIASRAVIGDGVDLEMQHGLPMPLTTKYRVEGLPPVVIPTYHPSAGLHDTAWMAALQEDFRTLKDVLAGRYVAPVDAYPDPYYFEATTLEEMEDYLAPHIETGVDLCGLDTEYDSLTGVPWCITVSVAPGTGMLISANRPDLLARLQYWLDRVLIAVHSAMADLPTTARMGLTLRRWIDTMQESYWAREFRIGLKILAWRRLGMKMGEYQDVVMPPSKLVLHEYMAEVAMVLDFVTPKTITKKKQSLYSPDELTAWAQRRKALQNVNRLIKALEDEITGVRKAEGELKPWTRIDEWDTAVIDTIESFAAKPVPRPSIAHVERAAAIAYACRDADAALRLAPVIRQRAQMLRRAGR